MAKRLTGTQNTRGLRVGRKAPVTTGFSEDFLDTIIGLGRLNIPRNPSGMGEYDFLEQVSTRDRKRLAGAMLTKRGKKTTLQEIGAIDTLHAAAVDQGVLPVGNMNADEFGAWYVKEAIRGLDFRKEIREAGGLKAYMRKKEREEAREIAERMEVEKQQFLDQPGSYRESYRARVFSDENFIGSSNFEYDSALRLREQAAFVAREYEGAADALVRDISRLEKSAGKIRSGQTSGKTLKRVLDDSKISKNIANTIAKKLF